MVRNAYVLMTALVPTTGHADLIDFAYRVSGQNTLVIVQGRTFEPIPTGDRVVAIRDHFSSYSRNLKVTGDIDDNASQNPDPILQENDTSFWLYWINNIRRHAASFGMPSITSADAIVASEPYGGILAKYLGCQFIPYDVKREINDAKGSDIRSDIWAGWDKILPEFKHNLQLNFVLFGQESVGKTTMAQRLTQFYRRKDVQFIPEYARGYLETVGAEITNEKMRTIEIGQNAIQEAAFCNQKKINFFDTDLLSTIGYYRIFEQRMRGNQANIAADHILHRDLVRNHDVSKDKMHYILLPDDIGFERDPLRYGGDRRQSTYQFWKDLLDEYDCTYTEVPRGLDFYPKIYYIVNNIIDADRDIMFDPISNFERD